MTAAHEQPSYAQAQSSMRSARAQIPHALRAVVRLGLTDLALVLAMSPAPVAAGAAQVAAFAAALAWLYPPDRFLTMRFRRRSDPRTNGLCALTSVPVGTGAGEWHLLGFVERIVR